jgi:hypothetical protein
MWMIRKTIMYVLAAIMPVSSSGFADILARRFDRSRAPERPVQP